MNYRGAFAIAGSLAVVGALMFALAPASSADPDLGDAAVCVFNGATPDDEFQNIDDPGTDMGAPEDLLDPNSPDNTGNGFTANKLSPQSVPTDATDLTDVELGAYEFHTNPSPLDEVLNQVPQIKDIQTSCIHLDGNAGTETGEGDEDNTGLYSATIDAVGDYENLICGTGSTAGNAELNTVDRLTATGFDGGPNQELSRINTEYWIMFAAGQGALLFTNDQDGANSPHAPVSDTALIGTGVVNIRPRPHPDESTQPGDPLLGCGDTPVTGFDVTGIVAGAVDNGNVSDDVNPSVDNDD